MGQKVNPNSLRVGINKYWQSTWFEKKDYSNFLKEDHSIRSYIEKNYAIASLVLFSLLFLTGGYFTMKKYPGIGQTAKAAGAAAVAGIKRA